MNFGNASMDSQPSFDASSYDSASSIRERDETYNSLQDRLKVLLKTQKRNEKLKNYIEEAKKKIEQHQMVNKQLQEELYEIINILELSQDSSLSTILEKIQIMKEDEALFLEISDIINNPNSTDKKSVISIVKENTLFMQAISEILGTSKSVDELVNEVKQLKQAKEEADSALSKLGTNNFEYLIENQEQADKQQRQICLLLDIKTESNKNSQHRNIVSAIKDLINKPSEILTDLGKLISPNFTEKVEDPQDIKNMINELKQKSSKFESQVEKLTSELQANKNTLSQFHFSNVDEATTIISDLLSKLSIKSPSMIQAEITKVFSEREELKSSIKSTNDELQKTKSKLKAKEDECEENQEKISEIKQQYKKIENEKNSLQNSIKDKSDEIDSLKSLLQTEKGNVKVKFDEFNDQISSLKKKNDELKSNQNQIEEKNRKLSSDLESLQTELESTKKSLKNEITEVKKEKSNLQAQFDQIKEQSENQISDIKEKERQLSKLQQEFDSIKESKENLESQVKINKEKSNNIQQILNIENPDQISYQIQKLLSEQDDLKRINNDLTKERQSVSKMLNISSEASISDAVSDLLEHQSEQKAENQDLSQKIVAVAQFLNIPDAQTATLSTIQKTIRNLQKEAETIQTENTKLRNENQSLNEKYEVLLDTQNEIQKSLNSDTFKSSNELIKAVSENENLISKSCSKLNVKREELFEKIKSNDEVISELCRELGTDESNLLQTVKNQKKSIGKAAQILNISGSSIENVIEENNELLNRICQVMKCSKEKVGDAVENNSKILNDLLKIADCEKMDQITSEFADMKKNYEQSKQALDDVMKKLHINSIDKVCSTVSDLQKEAEKGSVLERKTDEISGLLQIQEGKSSDDVKHSIQNLLSENKKLNDTMSRIQTIMNSTDVLNSVTLMSTIFRAIQKMMPKSTDQNDIPTIIGRYQSDSETLKRIQQMFPSTDTVSEVETMQKEMNEIYSIFNLKKFETPVELIKMNNDFVKTVFEIVNESTLSSPRSSRNSGRRNRNSDAGSTPSNTNELLDAVRKTFNEQREIMKLLGSDSPLNAVKRLIGQRDEISQLVDLNSDEEPTSAIQKVVGLKNTLSNLLDVNEPSDILSTIQKQNQTNKELFSLLNVEDASQLVSKATELAEVERILRKACPDEASLKDVILKIEKEKKLMFDIISKISSIVNTSGSANSSSSNLSAHSNSDKSKTLNHKQIVKKVEKLAKIRDEICELLNCSENSVIDQVKSMKDDLDSLNEIFNSEASGSGQSKLIQSAKEDKQILKSLARAVDVTKNTDILPKVTKYQNELEDVRSKLDQLEKFKSKLLSQMNCGEDEVKSIISKLLSSTNSSSIRNVPNFISSLKEKAEKMSHKIQKDNTFLSEFLSDGEMDGQYTNSDNLVQVTLSKLKQKNTSLEEKAARFDREMNKHANFIKGTNNEHYSIEQMTSIFRCHEDQLRQMKSLFSSSGRYSEIQETFQKVEQMHNKMKETTNQLTKSQQMLNQRNFEISNILSACNASSPEFAIDIIKSLKKQILDLNRENAELKMCKTVEESFQLFEKKEKKDFSAIASKLNEINNLLHALLSLIETGKSQKQEMKRLIEGALMESINLRETLEANEEKWMLFGSKKKGFKKSTISDEVRSRKKELADQKRKAEKAETTVSSQQQMLQSQSQSQSQQMHHHKQPRTLL